MPLAFPGHLAKLGLHSGKGGGRLYREASGYCWQPSEQVEFDHSGDVVVVATIG